MQTIKITIVTILMIALIVIIGPMDIFSHGYFCDTIPYDMLPESAITDYIYLEEQNYEMEFKPIKNHFAGFEIILANQPQENSGTLFLTVYDSNGNEIDEISTDVSKISENKWYRLYTSSKFKKNTIYTLKISAVDCQTFPYLYIIDPDYLTDENVSGDLMLGYAYAASTFTFQTKVLLSMFIVAVWGFICSVILRTKNYQKYVKSASIFLFLMSVLSWNYMYNSMDNNNTLFETFQADSETYVSGVIEARHYGIKNEVPYGLGRYTDVKGIFTKYGLTFLTDDNWNQGYSRTTPTILLNSNSYTKSVANEGEGIVEFINGDRFVIEKVEDDNTYLKIKLSADFALNPYKYGDLSDITFYNTSSEALPKGSLRQYKSQFGLQGKIFRRMAMASYMNYDEVIVNLNMFCSIASAFVFMLIVVLIYKKYNIVLSGCFFITFWLSPWIVNFARNLYWVEFTWFIPMAIGLFCSWKINSSMCRIISYISAFIAVMAKCLCGYEYISTVMMGMIAFLLVDLIIAVVKKDKEKRKLLIKTIFIISISALLGFVAAICIHGSLRADGNVLEGIKEIFENDVMRRTYGADMNKYEKQSERERLAYTASTWEVYCQYFHFPTEVIAGIAANLFPLLCIIPLGIFVYEHKMKKLNIELVSMYIVFFFASISWFCLAKQHSYVHTHMNYVLWYFGYIQICIYIIVNKIIEILTRKGANYNGGL